MSLFCENKKIHVLFLISIKQKSYKCDNQLITWLTGITRPAGSCNLVTLKTNFAQYKNFVCLASQNLMEVLVKRDHMEPSRLYLVKINNQTSTSVRRETIHQPQSSVTASKLMPKSLNFRFFASHYYISKISKL